MVFFSTGFDRAKAMAVQLGGKGDVTETHEMGSPQRRSAHPSMVLTGNEPYMVSDGGIASCVDARTAKCTGANALVEAALPRPSLPTANSIRSTKPARFTYWKPVEFNLLSQKSLGERSLASPAVAHGALYIRTAAIYGGLSRRRT